MDDNSQVTEIRDSKQGGGKEPRTRASIRRAIESELTDTRLKEVKGKLKKLVEERVAAEKVLRAKDNEIENLFEDYADILPA